MVRGARSGSSSWRGSRGRALFVASVVSPSAPPTVPAAVGASFESPSVAAEDAVSQQEGGDSFYESTLREVWINGDKIEPAQASQFITRTLQAHFPGPIHRFNDFPMKVQEHLYQMFMVPSASGVGGDEHENEEDDS
ncbi:hypothetical protein Taro_045246 [Colocasia esculenta]|uniref:Uncharacterized protein n=1 Tax=Colocasia esculenta TaxID=4460 RepID=A0A843X6B6_COLES|nr:hypothetical protein [Colocasia esculenta]